MAVDKGEKKEEISSDFTLNHYANTSKQYSRVDKPGDATGIQVPFSLAVKGPKSIRGRTVNGAAYKVTKS